MYKQVKKCLIMIIIIIIIRCFGPMLNQETPFR